MKVTCMRFRNILVFLIILGLFVVPATYAALDSNLQAPDEFEKASNWDTSIHDVYALKSDDDIELYICEYTDSDYGVLFKDDSANGYHVSDLADNMFMAKDNDFKDGYVLEVIEFEGEKYIVYAYLMDNPTNDEIEASSHYLSEFNELNGVYAISV